MKQDPTYRLTPVVMVTGQAQRDARLEGLEAGADDFPPSRSIHRSS